MRRRQKTQSARERVPSGGRPESSSLAGRLTPDEDSHLRSRRRVETGAPRVRRAEDDDVESAKTCLLNTHVETATEPADKELGVYRGEDALQEDFPYAVVPSE